MRLIDADAYIYSNDLKNEPTIEAEPVRHGDWRFCGSDRWNDAYVCSECGKIAQDDSNYCPNCGAKMRGTTDE